MMERGVNMELLKETKEYNQPIVGFVYGRARETESLEVIEIGSIKNQETWQREKSININ